MESTNKEKNLKRILVCIDWYEPGFKAGGPIRSVVNIINALKEEFEFYLLTSAYDLGETEPYPDIPLNQWFDKDGILIKYLSKDNMKSSAIRGNILEIAPDLLYLNSLFSSLFTLIPLRMRKKIPIIIAPRGMLGAGALTIKKNKKKTFLRLAKITQLYKRVTWHASSSLEANEIYNMFGDKSKVYVAQNIPIVQTIELEQIKSLKTFDTIKIVFISRISKKKNLLTAIKTMHKLALTTPVEFTIYGHIEEVNYFRQLKLGFVKSPKLTIQYGGILRPTEIKEVYAKANYMFMPTEHENYGHAIVEAWAYGCPVIISKNTPWLDLEEKNIGWDVSLEESDELVNALQAAIDLPEEEYLKMVEATFSFFAEHLAAEKVIESNKELFNNVS
jgi:glycosyltransferase involved in cell wall biosynthesis